MPDSHLALISGDQSNTLWIAAAGAWIKGWLHWGGQGMPCCVESFRGLICCSCCYESFEYDLLLWDYIWLYSRRDIPRESLLLFVLGIPLTLVWLRDGIVHWMSVCWFECCLHTPRRRLWTVGCHIQNTFAIPFVYCSEHYIVASSWWCAFEVHSLFSLKPLLFCPSVTMLSSRTIPGREVSGVLTCERSPSVPSQPFGVGSWCSRMCRELFWLACSLIFWTVGVASICSLWEVEENGRCRGPAQFWCQHIIWAKWPISVVRTSMGRNALCDGLPTNSACTRCLVFRCAEHSPPLPLR